MEWLTPQQILFIHYRLIEATGGAHGVRDLGALQAAASRPAATFDGQDLYATPYAKAAALFESLIRNHPFLDGNKRTAITSAALLLRRFGYAIDTSQEELYSFTISMATGAASREDAERWLKMNSTALPVR